MVIVRRPSASTEVQADRFITGGVTPSSAAGKRTPVIVRFAPELLARVDAAAKRRGISRSSWLQFVASRAIDSGDG